MLRWNNDYNRGAHPAVLAALAETNGESYPGYGLDPWCRQAAAEIQAHLGGAAAEVHFFTGATQANFTLISAALRPWQSVLCADSGHIHAHETGAAERTGHKLLVLPARDGKLTADQLRAEAAAYRASGVREHLTQPKLVYLSQPTEWGTLYSKGELTAIRQVCDAFGLYLFLDGARLAYALGAPENDLTLADLAALCDAFYLGGTKCGALFGEAMVLVNDDLKPDFRASLKQNGALLAKGWLLGLQFSALLRDGLYFDLGRRGVACARTVRQALADRGVPCYVDSPTNQQFPILTPAQASALGERHIFEDILALPDGRRCVRFCTGWHTDPRDAAVLAADLAAL